MWDYDFSFSTFWGEWLSWCASSPQGANIEANLTITGTFWNCNAKQSFFWVMRSCILWHWWNAIWSSLSKWKLMQNYNFVFVDDIFHNYLAYLVKHREIWFIVLLYSSVEVLGKVQQDFLLPFNKYYFISDFLWHKCISVNLQYNTYVMVSI